MDRRYQVFISSTFEDLVDERKAIMEGLLKIDCLPAGMELFPAADDDQWTLIKQVIDQCDYYLIVSARRYGSVDPEGISYTEREYDYATEAGIPVIGFLPRNPGEIIGDKIENGEGVAEKLANFQQKIKSRMVDFYASPAELQANVIIGVTKLQRSKPRPGWVRGDQAMTEEKRTEMAEMRARIAELEAHEAKSEANLNLKPGTEINAKYAHGDEMTIINFSYFGWSNGKRVSRNGQYEWEWDDVMFTIGPALIEEATEHKMINLIQEQLVLEVHNDEQVEDLSEIITRLNESTWSNILVQLRALKAITPGTKKRAASNHNKYWQLTPAGDQWVTELRAQPHEDAEPQSAVSLDA